MLAVPSGSRVRVMSMSRIDGVRAEAGWQTNTVSSAAAMAENGGAQNFTGGMSVLPAGSLRYSFTAKCSAPATMESGNWRTRRL